MRKISSTFLQISKILLTGLDNEEDHTREKNTEIPGADHFFFSLFDVMVNALTTEYHLNALTCLYVLSSEDVV